MTLRKEYISLTSFIIFSFILLCYNADYLYTIQDNGVFISGSTFMKDMVNHYGGWVTWIACYLTQFFYYPCLGAAILIALWSAIYYSAIWLFPLRGWLSATALIAPSALLLNVLDYGYWIYYAKTPGFAFAPTLLVLFICLVACSAKALLLLLQALLSAKGKLLSAKASLFSEGNSSEKGTHLSEGNPSTKGTHLSEGNPSTKGTHLSEGNPSTKSTWLRTPTTSACLVILGAITTPLVGTWRLNNHTPSLRTTLLDSNFRHELSMYRSLDAFRFEEVLDESLSYGDQPTNLMVMYKNIALLHTGRLTEMFETTNCGIRPDTHDSPKIRTTRLGASLIYYMYGLYNFSYRWAMENSVQYGQSFRSLRMMARCAMMNGEQDVAAKYLSILQSSTFHRSWAKTHTAMLINSTLLVQSKEYEHLAPLSTILPDALDSDEGLPEAYLMDYFSELPRTTSSTEDLALCHSLWGNNAYAFCIHFHDYVNRHPSDAIPALYQQGAILLGNQPNSPITLDGFDFAPLIAQQYNAFLQAYRALQDQGASDQSAAQQLRPAYGDTYWWHYYFAPAPAFY